MSNGAHQNNKRSARAWGVTALVTLSLLGCNEEQHKQQLAAVQAEADKRVAAAEAKAKERVTALEKELEVAKAEVVAAGEKAKAAAEEAVSKAQASLEDAEKDTAKALERARIAYKAEAKARYQALNADLAEVTSKAGKIPAKTKPAYDKIIKDILAIQKDITRDIAAYDQATLDTFGKAKSKVDVSLAKYKAAIKAAKAKLPKTTS